MKIVVFYRSREVSNSVASSAQERLHNDDFSKNLDIEFVNLDKRNYTKFLNQMEILPDYIYIWYDEEKISDYIAEAFPAIKVKHFNSNYAIGYNSCGYAKCSFTLADEILNTFKDNLIKEVKYVVERGRKITKEEIDEWEQIEKSSNGAHIFSSRKEAKEYIKQTLIHEIKTYESKINRTQKDLKTQTETLKKLQRELQKYLKSTE